MGIFNEFNKKEKPVFTGSRFGFGAAAAVTTSTPAVITTRGIIFDWDPGDVTGLSDGGATTNADLVSGIDQDNTAGSNTAIAVSGGTVTYRTANGGYFDSTSGGGCRIIVSGTSVVSALDACASMTITCWFQSNGSSRQVLVSRYGTGYPNQFNHIVDPSGDFHFNSSGAIGGASGDIDNATNYWDNNTWHLCHWTYDVSDGFARWYIDGSATGATANFGTDSGNGLTVSDPDGFGIMSRADDNERLIGYMGPVRIHNVALTAQECANDFAAERDRFGV